MRLEGQGRVDRSQPLRFTFDGVHYRGFDGDTVASALMGAGVSVLGRSFKYHRPRGVVTAVADEPNALMQVGRGAAQVPNVRATDQMLYDGLRAESQNRWPSLAFDVMEVNDWAAPWLGAGFYYKTFMWPASFWEKVYEPLIRRAAGLGALSGKADEAFYEKAFGFCDLLVIGAGPAGLMAAVTAAEAGADVILMDDGTAPGGRLLAEREEVQGQAGHAWAAALWERLARYSNVRVMARTTVTGAYDHGTYAALERVSDTGELRGCFWRIAAKRAILCGGSLERLVAFRDNDRPGVMMAGALRAFINRWGVAPGKRVAVFGNNDDAHRTARDAQAAGLSVVALVDSRKDAENLAGDVPFFSGAQVTRAFGRKALNAIEITRGNGRVVRYEVDALGVSGGWNPAVHLTCHMNGRPIWCDARQAFLPRDGAVPGLHVAGSAAGVFSTAGCLRSGAEQAVAALDALGISAELPKLPEAEDRPYRLRALWAVPGKGRAWLDLQNDVTVKDVALAAQENFRSVEHMKRYTTQGMATDQGKGSNVTALAVLADATWRSIPQTGTTTFRPPYTPVPIASMGAGGHGMGFAPQRFTTSHAASVALGAPMIEAGLWYRPSYFPQPGETTWRQSCDREVMTVREAVGVCDVSTLGKIELHGPDVGRFLDFVYCNTFSTLKPGRVRYGLMLREDGHVMDDGTTARLTASQWVMTTTTAAAGLVMQHLGFVQQAFCRDMAVRFASVTEQWAQFAITGPKACDVLNKTLDTPIPSGELPFMACASVTVGGIAGRLFRISFSGELGFELAVPSRYGAALFDHLVATAKSFGGGPYGMEALNVLRLEKGFITHAEIDGRVTAQDIGMGRMVSSKKDCIGKVMAARPGLVDEARPQMVGLRPVDLSAEITAGAHLFNSVDKPVRRNDLGYVTSVGYSPTLGHSIALAFLQGGAARQGSEIKAVDHIRAVTTRCIVTAPGQFDPEGGRMRD